ncbi:MAG TPA: ATPase domain-containing protein, partial [Saliniramus sp.]|nr:ATPase domain-containing protein [Saliniramus sp.]
IRLEQVVPPYGSERRRLTVTKMRGTAFRGGYHDLVIERGGVRIFPRLVASDHHSSFVPEPVASNVPELDAILGGGLNRGTSTLIVGPSGAGKSTLALGYVWAALERGERALMVSFDETIGILLERAKGIGFDLAPHVDAGRLRIEQIDPADISPGEFAGRVREAVSRDGVRIVLIDSITGYLHAMPEQPYIVLQMHEMLTYLNQQGVVTIMILAQHGIVGTMASPVDLTYLSDCVVMLRFFEASGRIRRALSIMKKRVGRHEDTIREFRIDQGGLRVGEPLEQFSGVLTGVPTFDGDRRNLLNKRDFADKRDA